MTTDTVQTQRLNIEVVKISVYCGAGIERTGPASSRFADEVIRAERLRYTVLLARADGSIPRVAAITPRNSADSLYIAHEHFARIANENIGTKTVLVDRLRKVALASVTL